MQNYLWVPDVTSHTDTEWEATGQICKRVGCCLKCGQNEKEPIFLN